MLCSYIKTIRSLVYDREFLCNCIWQRLEEQLQNKDRESEMYEKLKTAEEEQKKAETEADKYYDQYCKEEAKVCVLEDNIKQKSKEIEKLKEDIDKMVSAGYAKPDDNISVLKRKFTELYSRST